MLDLNDPPEHSFTQDFPSMKKVETHSEHVFVMSHLLQLRGQAEQIPSIETVRAGQFVTHPPSFKLYRANVLQIEQLFIPLHYRHPSEH